MESKNVSISKTESQELQKKISKDLKNVAPKTGKSSYSASGGTTYLVNAAKLACTQGDVQTPLVIPHTSVQNGGQGYAYKSDNKVGTNIIPFGNCTILKGPCIPVIVGEWMAAKDDRPVDSSLALTTDSFLICAVGGLIEPMNSGQSYASPDKAKLEGILEESLKKNADYWISRLDANEQTFENIFPVGGNTEENRRKFREEEERLLKAALNADDKLEEYEACIQELEKLIVTNRSEKDVIDSKAVTVVLSKIGKLLEKYTGIPAEVWPTVAAVESGSGSYKGRTNKEESAKTHNLWGFLYAPGKLVPFDNYSYALAAMTFNFSTYFAYKPLIESKTDDDLYDFEKWLLMLSKQQDGFSYRGKEYYGTGYNGHENNYGLVAIKMFWDGIYVNFENEQRLDVDDIKTFSVEGNIS